MFERLRGGRRAQRIPVLPSDAALLVEKPAGAAQGSCPREVEVWYVAERSGKHFDPYFIARCSCEWVGTAHDAQNTYAALEAACAEAFAHGAMVAREVVRMLD